MSTVPAWATVAIAFLTGALGLLGAVIAARIAARTREEELSQERLLHGADARLKALDEATITAIDYRERIAAALSLLADSSDPQMGVEPLWELDRAGVMVFLRHDAALTLRFGRTHPVAVAWRDFAWEIGGAADVARKQQHRLKGGSGRVPKKVKKKARVRRRATRKKLEKFLEFASPTPDGGTGSLVGSWLAQKGEQTPWS